MNEDITDRLSRRIASLHDDCSSLTGAVNLKDLAGRFMGLLSLVFQGVNIEILFLPPGGQRWRVLSDRGGEKPLEAISLPKAGVREEGTVASNGMELLLVQRLVDDSHLALRLCRPGSHAFFDNSDLVTLQLTAHLFDVGYRTLHSHSTEKQLIFSLNHRVLQLNSLIDTGIEVSKLGRDVQPHHLALQRAASVVNASKGVISVSVEGRTVERYMFPMDVPESHDVQEGSRIASAFTFGGSTYTFELFEKESRAGVVPFDETDQLLLDALSRQVHASLENQYLHAQALEKQKIDQDLAVAASIQRRILPETLPTIHDYDIAGVNIPSRMVGGDYYDCLPLPGGRFALVIADVSGKGINAALLVSSFHAFLSAYVEAAMPLLEMAGRLNRAVCRASTSDKFITGFLAILNPATGEMETLNAGHTPGLLRTNDGTIRELSTGGIPFGMLDMDFPFQSERLTLGRGESLLLYTDGVTEAANEKEELFEQTNSLKEFMLRQKPSRADEFIRTLLSDMKRFTGAAPQSDDITAMYLLRH